MDKVFKREIYLRRIRGFYHDRHTVKVLTGVKRSGKSTVMKMIIEELRESGVERQNILYYDLGSFTHKDVDTAIRLYLLISANASRAKKGETKYLFIDEVQKIPNFDDVLNDFLSEGSYSIFVTGASSYLAEREMSAKLIGRSIEFEIMPLNFMEYREMKQFYGMSVIQNDMAELHQYIIDGGFPGALQYDRAEDKYTQAKIIMNEIYEKEIKDRIKARYKEKFFKVLYFLITNVGKPLSVPEIAREMQKDNIGLDEIAIRNYLSILVDTKLICECKRYDISLDKELNGNKIYYLPDTSLYLAVNTSGRIDYTQIFKNIVYVYLRSQGYQISAGKLYKFETDFILRDSEQNCAYVQVAHSILGSKETEDAVYESLEHIKDNYPKFVLTTDHILQKRNGIIHQNFIDFIINNHNFLQNTGYIVSPNFNPQEATRNVANT